MPQSEMYRLAVDKLIVDPAIQRNLDQRRVGKIVSEFDMEAVGVLTVSHRSNGSYHIVDGQHRAAAARLALGDAVELACRVFTGLSAKDEARLFRRLNTTAKPQALDLFRIRVVEGDAAAIDIDRILREAGWDSSLAHGMQSAFSAVAAADRLYKLDPSAMQKSITTMTKAWGHDEADGRVFEGIGMVFARHGDAIELSNLAERLSVFPGGQRGLLGRARGLAEMVSTTVGRAVAEVVVEVYNARRKTRALPAWRS